MSFHSPLLKALAVVTTLFFAPIVTAAWQDAPAPEKPPLELGRTAIRQVQIAQGSLAVRSIALANNLASVIHLTRAEVKGEGLALAFTKQRTRLPVALATTLDYELPANDSIRLEITIDTKGQELGSRGALLTLTTDAAEAKTVELPVEWEVVEPKAAEDENSPIPKPKTDWTKLVGSGPPPKISCEPIMHEFGKVLSGERLKTSFTIKNEGEGDLVIVKVGAQCHCTLPRLVLPSGIVTAKALRGEEVYGKLKPGEEATLECEIDTSGMGGRQAKEIRIDSNDLARTPQTVRMSMTVDKPFEFNPASANFGDVRRNDPQERVIRMASLDLGEFAIVGHDLPQPTPFDVEYHQVEPKKREQCAWEIRLRTRPDLPCGEYSGKLRLELDHPRIKVLDQLNYALKILPDVTWTIDRRSSTDTFTMGVVKPGVNDVKSILFENKSPGLPWIPREVTITSRQSADPFAAEIVELEKGMRYEIKLKIVKPPQFKSFSGELHVLSDCPSLPEAVIKFSGLWSGNVPVAPPIPPPVKGGR